MNSAVDNLADLQQPWAFETILYGGLTVGVLDGLDAVVFFGLRGSSAHGIFQYIASGLLDRAAFSGVFRVQPSGCAVPGRQAGTFTLNCV